MDSLDDTVWDVVISGTGLQQSLLALALSRSDKRVLHVDRNDYYGGPDAAFSLQEAESWSKRIVDESPYFKHVSVSQHDAKSGASDGPGSGLSFSRAYSLSLSPQIIYTQSPLLGALVSSKVYRQLEFQAIGSWWIYSHSSVPDQTLSDDHGSEGTESRDSNHRGTLRRVPGGREDVFADTGIDLRSKRTLMKFLKFVADFEDQEEVWEQHASTPFTDFLTSQFSLPAQLHLPLLAIAMTPYTYQKTTTAFALPRIARHLRSIGRFGPGFGAVIPKWGGGAEIAQVACRAGAVGGAVYMLGNDLRNIVGEGEESEGQSLTRIELRNGEVVRARWIVRASPADGHSPAFNSSSEGQQQLKAIYIMSSPLSTLFTTVAEGGPQPAGAVVMFPPGSLETDSSDKAQADMPPVYVVAHSSETGECPAGQCILYASIMAHERSVDHDLLDQAVERLLASLDGNDESAPRVLYTLRYTQSNLAVPQTSTDAESTMESASKPPPPGSSDGPVLVSPPTSLDPVFDDALLDQVKEIWKKVMRQPDGNESDNADEFMVFEDREGMVADLEGDD
ncbi:MAG: Rab proteins geranylgeranyltransferase component A [Peltula sp. TS41687]|nr:MAG: Rab proteins geranylgeranyltransferase component A [Peltula sp. TS41687]